jgi:hypothetical protein
VETDVALAARNLISVVAELAGRQSTLINIHLSRDDPVGARAPGQLTVSRTALLFAPVPFVSHRSYMVHTASNHLPAEVMLSVLNIFEFPVTSAYRNIMWNPTATSG